MLIIKRIKIDAKLKDLLGILNTFEESYRAVSDEYGECPILYGEYMSAFRKEINAVNYNTQYRLSYNEDKKKWEIALVLDI